MRTKLSLFLKQKNIAAVLKALHLEQAVSRAKIALLTGIAPSTVSNIIDKLEREQIVEYIDGSTTPSSVGRPPVMIRFNPSSFYAIGIEINLFNSRVMVVGIDGRVIKKHRIDVDARTNPDGVLSSLAEATGRLISESGVEWERVMGIGISFRGLIDRTRGLVQRSTSLPEWGQKSVVDIFQKTFPCPSFVENNANAMVLGETRFGNSRGKRNVLGVIVEEGIGGGIMINGRLYLGNHSAAGELGHMSIAPSGPVCHCGNRGCLRTLCSESAVEANAIRIVKSGANTLLEARSDVENPSMTAQDVVNAAQREDTVCIDIINDAARHLGMALVNLVNLLCPEVVVFNNGTLPSYPAFLEEVRRLISERSYSKDLGTPELRISSLGESAVCIGAACVVMDRILAEDRAS